MLNQDLQVYQMAIVTSSNDIVKLSYLLQKFIGRIPLVVLQTSYTIAMANKNATSMDLIQTYATLQRIDQAQLCS